MAVVAQPIDASSGVPAYSAQQSRQAFSAHLGGATGARPLGAFSGVRPGTPTTTVSLSGAGSTTWTVGAHSGVLDTQTPVAAAPYEYACDGADTGTLTAADATNPRIDVIWVAVNDTVQDGSGLRGGLVGYTAGTPAGTPAVPSPSNPRGMVLAQVNVPKAGTGSPTVTWVAPYCVATGGVRNWTTAAGLQASAGAFDGQLAWAMDTHQLFEWSATGSAWAVLADPSDRTAWTNYVPVWTSESGGTTAIGTGGVLSGRYKKIGFSCDGWMNMLVGTSASGPAGVWNWTLPVVAALQAGANVDVPIGSGTYFGPTGGVLHGDVYARYSSGGARFVVQFHGQSAPAQPSNPSTWPAAARMMVNFRYETAS